MGDPVQGVLGYYYIPQFKEIYRYSLIRALDLALHAPLKSALQRPDKNPATRAKIETILGRKNDTQ